jgi:hypothetical protein
MENCVLLCVLPFGVARFSDACELFDVLPLSFLSVLMIADWLQRLLSVGSP